MIDCGIKKVIYSIADDFIIEKVKNMKKTHISSGTNYIKQLKQK